MTGGEARGGRATEARGAWWRPCRGPGPAGILASSRRAPPRDDDPPVARHATAGAGTALARAGAVVLVGYLLARGLGYIRLLVYAAIFGAGAELDAFSVAFRLPDLVLSLVASGALAAAVVGAALVDGRAAERAGQTASGLLTCAAQPGALRSRGGPGAGLIPILAPGFPAETTELAIALSREMAIAPLLLGLGGMVGGILQAERHYGPATLGPIAYNVVSVASAIVLSGALGAHALSVGVVGGSAAYLLVQLPALASMGLRLRPSVDLSEPGLRRAVGLLGPRALGLSVDQLKLILVVAAASTLALEIVDGLHDRLHDLRGPAGVLAVPSGPSRFPRWRRSMPAASARRWAGWCGRPWGSCSSWSCR